MWRIAKRLLLVEAQVLVLVELAEFALPPKVEERILRSALQYECMSV